MRYMNTGVIPDAVFKFDCPAGVLVACRYDCRVFSTSR